MEVASDISKRNPGGNSFSLSGKENLKIGRALSNGPEVLCPVTTSTAVAIAEQPELRAYKLGKQKCSYNQVELVFTDISLSGKASALKVSEAIETVLGTEVDECLRESCLKFNVRFLNNKRIHLYIYVVYATPYCSSQGTDKSSLRYHWVPVTRSKCRKGCSGAVIRGLQRFGRMSRRGSNTANRHDGEEAWKEPRHLYIAIDEASTHVCARPETSKFRLLVAAYDETYQLLGTAVSTSIRVLANNDAPLGAASFKLHCNLKENGLSASNQRLFGAVAERHCCRVPLQDIAQKDPFSGQKSLNGEETDSSYATSTVSQLVADNTSRSTDETWLEASSDCMKENEFFHDHVNVLTSTCERLFAMCASKKEQIVYCKSLAIALGCGRQQLAAVFDVLQPLDVVSEQGKGKYLWQPDITRISEALEKIKMKMLSQTPYIEAESLVEEIPSKLLQLLMANANNSLSWQDVVNTIFPRRGYNVEEEVKKLCDAISILSTMHFITLKYMDKYEMGNGPILNWIGVPGVERYLKFYERSDCEQQTPKERVIHDFGSRGMEADNRKRKRSGISSSSDDASDAIPCETLKEEQENKARSHTRRETRRNLLLLASCCDLSETTLESPISSNSVIPNMEPEDGRTPKKTSHDESGVLFYDEREDNMCTETSQASPDRVAGSRKNKEGNESEAKCKSIWNEYLRIGSSFDPLYHLQRLFSPKHVAKVAQDNPAFLFEYVRCCRQLHHMLNCNNSIGVAVPSSVAVSRPLPRRLISTFSVHPCTRSKLLVSTHET